MAETEIATTTFPALPQAKERIAAASVLAVVLPDRAALDIIGSAVALVDQLRSAGKTVGVFSAPHPTSQDLAAWQDALGDEEPLREFIISFDLSRSPIKELKYERENDRLNILLSPTGSRIRREDVEFRYGNLRYELVITLGVPKLEAAAQSLARVPELPHEKPIVNIDSNPANTHYGDLNLVPSDAGDRLTLPEMIFLLLGSLKLASPSTEAATALFTALAVATENFALDRTTAAAFQLAATLRELGADPDIANRYLSAPRPLPEAQLTGRALARTRFDAETKTLWASLTPDDFRKTETELSSARGVLIELRRLIPYARRHFLLAQPAPENKVEAFIAAPDAGDANNLERIGAIRDDHAWRMTGDFPSFAEAESRLFELLRELDAVQ